MGFSKLLKSSVVFTGMFFMALNQVQSAPHDPEAAAHKGTHEFHKAIIVQEIQHHYRMALKNLQESFEQHLSSLKLNGKFAAAWEKEILELKAAEQKSLAELQKVIDDAQAALKNHQSKLKSLDVDLKTKKDQLAELQKAKGAERDLVQMEKLKKEIDDIKLKQANLFKDLRSGHATCSALSGECRALSDRCVPAALTKTLNEDKVYVGLVKEYESCKAKETLALSTEKALIAKKYEEFNRWYEKENKALDVFRDKVAPFQKAYDVELKIFSELKDAYAKKYEAYQEYVKKKGKERTAEGEAIRTDALNTYTEMKASETRLAAHQTRLHDPKIELDLYLGRFEHQALRRELPLKADKEKLTTTEKEMLVLWKKRQDELEGKMVALKKSLEDQILAKKDQLKKLEEVLMREYGPQYAILLALGEKYHSDFHEYQPDLLAKLEFSDGKKIRKKTEEILKLKPLESKGAFSEWLALGEKLDEKLFVLKGEFQKQAPDPQLTQKIADLDKSVKELSSLVQAESTKVEMENGAYVSLEKETKTKMAQKTAEVQVSLKAINQKQELVALVNKVYQMKLSLITTEHKFLLSVLFPEPNQNADGASYTKELSQKLEQLKQEITKIPELKALKWDEHQHHVNLKHKNILPKVHDGWINQKAPQFVFGHDFTELKGLAKDEFFEEWYAKFSQHTHHKDHVQCLVKKHTGEFQRQAELILKTLLREGVDRCVRVWKVTPKKPKPNTDDFTFKLEYSGHNYWVNNDGHLEAIRSN